MSKITDAIVFGNPNYDENIFTDEYREGCTDDELKVSEPFFGSALIRIL